MGGGKGGLEPQVTTYNILISAAAKAGQWRRAEQLLDEMPEFTEQAIAETDGGALTWLLHALDLPDYNATLHGYGTVIGTGNAVVEWPAWRHQEGSA